MNLLFVEGACEDYLYWQNNDKNMLKRVNTLIKECTRTLFDGIGKPEPLRFDMAGYWSCTIDAEHRLIYKCDDDKLIILQCKYHY